jgi:hypothetical protein
LTDSNRERWRSSLASRAATGRFPGREVDEGDDDALGAALGAAIWAQPREVPAAALVGDLALHRRQALDDVACMRRLFAVTGATNEV